jgi:uncharacterized protein
VTDLPVFKYHRDPILSGSVEESKKKCKCCKQARGYIYSGPVYAEKDLDNAICPWCIADGSAHTKFDATFVEADDFPEDVPPEAALEVSCRTPGYSTWQSQRWFSCCGDAMTFVEPAGIAEIRKSYPELEGSVMGNIVHDLEVSGSAANRLLESLRRDAGPTAYVFQCTKCGAYRSFVDGIFDVEE